MAHKKNSKKQNKITQEEKQALEEIEVIFAFSDQEENNENIDTTEENFPQATKKPIKSPSAKKTNEEVV